MKGGQSAAALPQRRFARGCGVLLHVSSLHGNGPVGTMGAEARRFVDFLRAAGQRWWQVLPLNAPERGNSPYSAFSVFSGNPWLISLPDLAGEGLLPSAALPFLPRRKRDAADYDTCARLYPPLLRLAYQHSAESLKGEILAFRRQNGFWLEDFALFLALREEAGNAPFREWSRPLLLRDPSALGAARVRLAEEIGYHVFVQYLFFRQWGALRGYAHGRGVSIIGDLPIYPDIDSADVWAHPGFFQLDGELKPSAFAGVPPDDFSDEGQLWGNPLYDWDALRISGYSWWIERLRTSARLYDALRIDHFRALDSYYAIPTGAGSAQEGHWMPGPGMDFLHAVHTALPGLRLIAEDLGLLTGSVRRLLADSGLPGMKVLQFAFDPAEESDHLPHRFPRHCVAYIGTHDNDTLLGWMRGAPRPETLHAGRYLHLSAREGYHWGFIRALYASVADTAIVQMQDLLGLGSEARMNTPAVPGGNWTWRLREDELTDSLARRIRSLAKLYGRVPAKSPGRRLSD